MAQSNDPAYNLRMHGLTNHSQHHSLSRRDIARAIIRKYRGTDRYTNIGEHKMNLIISRILELKVETLFKKGYISVGGCLGLVELKRCELKPNMEFADYKIDWKSTVDLWLRDDKAKQNKTLVRFLNVDCKYKIHWKRGVSKNLNYFSFTPSRTLRCKLVSMIKNNKPIVTLNE